MDRLLEGRTSFIIAHRLSTIKNADCIIYNDRGGIQEMGSHEQLMSKKGNYYNLYVSQNEQIGA
jgi:ATP-binding cassette subfamily B protein